MQVQVQRSCACTGRWQCNCCNADEVTGLCPVHHDDDEDHGDHDDDDYIHDGNALIMIKAAGKKIAKNINHQVNLRIVHLRIGNLLGNPEVDNSEYMSHQDCPPQ